jgi:DNA (cytosine-5)-methyltransferase 1
VKAGSERPVVVDVFAGAGGLSLGFEQAGFEVAAAVEYDPIHALAHRYNFPNSEVLCRDVRRVHAADIHAAAASGVARTKRYKADVPQIDVLIGGPSCQGFSSGGRRDDDDERNELLLHFVRLVCEVGPRAFVLENVPGLLEPRFKDFRTSAFDQLRRAGYSLTGTDRWVDASDFGVAQVRKRVIVIGLRDGTPHDLVANESRAKWTVRDAFDGLPKIEDYPELLYGDSVELRKNDRRRRERTESTYARELSGLSEVRDLSRPRIWNESLTTNSLRTVHSAETIRRFVATEPGATEPVSRFYRLLLDSPSRTLRAGTGSERGAHTSPRPIHPIHPRVITVREAARLHGYPDWFRLASTNWHGHRQVGNSVPPPLAKAAAEIVMAALGRRPRKLIAKLPLGDISWLATRPDAAAKIVSARPSELPPQRIRRTSRAIQ